MTDLMEPDISDAPDDDNDSLDPLSPAQLSADINDQWSWASSVARIPQLFDLAIQLAEPLARARITVRVHDSDIEFQSKVVHEGPLPSGTTVLPPTYVPLSARAMSQVDDRVAAECAITLQDVDSDRVLARVVKSIDLQPRNLWLFMGDPRRDKQLMRIQREFALLSELLTAQPEHPEADEIRAEIEVRRPLVRQAFEAVRLSRALLAAFVRPNHPEISLIAREVADQLGRVTGDSRFYAFQEADVAAAERRVDQTVTAIYEVLQARAITYSEPPPGWDYDGVGQRIRDHGEVARGGLGTCMDTTVLTAAVLEQVGLLPLLVLVPGHIFVGYWRRNPEAAERASQWYPGTAVIEDREALERLLKGGWLGVIETTLFASGKGIPAAKAGESALATYLEHIRGDGTFCVIDVIAARRAGVSPLPAVNHRADGVTEVIEYRPGGTPTVTEVSGQDPEASVGHRVDEHPARYRTWKSSLFSLSATNALLNLGNSARVQPIVLPAEGLGTLEDRLNQDITFSLRSGYDVPEVWSGRGKKNALQVLESADPDDRGELLAQLANRQIFVQRVAHSRGQLTALSQATFVRELRSMAHNAKVARDERGMNPLYLCLGLLQWDHKPGATASAPLILVPVNLSPVRGRAEFSLSLDAAQQTTPNAALIEWLRRTYGLTVPDFAEPLTDRAGLDIDGILSGLRNTIARAGLAIDISAEARLATLDLSAFRMWQDMNLHGDKFLERPLIRHLVHSPTEQFEDEAVAAAGDDLDASSTQLESLETPIPADSTQKRAVLWARQGRTFVLQGPPGTGKSQTITNMVAECVLSGMRVLFVAEKGTALAVVQRRLDAIGLAPFTLNLHHEGSNAVVVREQLRRALAASVSPDPAAMTAARRTLRNAQFQLGEYPRKLHERNAAGFSAYTAQDELLVLGEGHSIALPTDLVAHRADQVEALQDAVRDLQRWTDAAGVRPDHPWRLAGTGDADPFDVSATTAALEGVLDGTAWATMLPGQLGEALRGVVHPQQLDGLVWAANPVLPGPPELAEVLTERWQTDADRVVTACEQAVAAFTARLEGFAPTVIELDLRGMAQQLRDAAASGFLGRNKRKTAAIAPLASVAPAGVVVDPADAERLLTHLIDLSDKAAEIRSTLASVAGLAATVPDNPFVPGALQPARRRLDELRAATAPLLGDDSWIHQVVGLAEGGHLAPHVERLSAFAGAWRRLWVCLRVQEADFEVWRGSRGLVAATDAVRDVWRRQAGFERLLPLQQWCALMRRLAPLQEAGLHATREQILDGSLPAERCEDALARGLAKASLAERVATAGLDRFSGFHHDERVSAYAQAQSEMRRQWVTEAAARLLDRRGGRGAGAHTGGLARELEKTTHKLSTRAIMRKYPEAVQELVPLILCSPSSVVDLIEPGIMEFDVVVFDEASQITVPEAVGALGRARAAIVVGDTKQMPPSRRIGGGASNDDEVDDPDLEEIVEDQESILSECELARVPTLRLDWHYRSQDEALIAFSNRAYYRGTLSSFPTPTLLSSETGVEFRRIDGRYLRAGSGRVKLSEDIEAGSNTNPDEARAIVREVEELVSQPHNPPSIGIVTFNEQQRQLIVDLLGASREPRVAEVMDENRMGPTDVLFVKALEQVQGDERDVVMFSIAFSKQANGKIPTNFGPLSNSGGERRLNVAVTRARRKNIVFCSFDPEALVVSGSAYKGPKDLKEFLLFAKAAGNSDEELAATQRLPIRDRHRDDIADALRAAGLHVRCDVGMSGFRLDLVLATPEHPDRPLLPVLLDGESWRKRSTVSDRDVLPVEVLENLMGWPKVLRIWWPMWLQNRDDVVARVLAEVASAEAVLEASHPVEAPTPVQPEGNPVAPDAVAAKAEEHLDTGGTSPHIRGAVDVPAQGENREVYRPRRSAGVEEPDEGNESAPLPPLPSPRQAGLPPASQDSLTRFVPAHTNRIGSKSVLDALSDRENAALVRSQIIDIVDAEGPVQVVRLTRIVGRRFELGAVRQARTEEIARLIPRSQHRKSRLGEFVWPAHLDPATWTGYRADPLHNRSLDEVAPEELANAMKSLQAQSPSLSHEDLLRRTAEIFGFTRLGANVRERLEAVAAKWV